MRKHAWILAVLPMCWGSHAVQARVVCVEVLGVNPVLAGPMLAAAMH